MTQAYTVHYKEIKRGKNVTKEIDFIVDERTGEVVEPTCHLYNCPEDYENAGYIGLEPMSAKDPLNEEQQEEMFNSLDTIAEEKMDGVRGTLHIKEHENRMFSRRISKNTEWYGDNSDRLPQFRDYLVPQLDGTVLDGELIIPNVRFEDTSGMLNMDWDKAIERQCEIGLCKFIVFDIIYYKNIYVAKMPLEKRKKYAELVVKELNNPLIVMGDYTCDYIERPVTPLLINTYDEDPDAFKELYPSLCAKYEECTDPVSIQLDKKQWYEYVVLHGGEGLMLKDYSKPYEHKRCRNYTKIKKFGTWDVVITGFLAPTREYTGKELSTWEYFENGEPVTKHHYMGWIGKVSYGVIITPEELNEWQKKNPKTKPVTFEINGNLILDVGDCSGFDEEIRAYMTSNQNKLIGTVIEVKAHEVLKTGKLRHPRFVRFRNDKDAYQCTYIDHIRG